MLEYEWGNPSSIMLSGDESVQDSEQTRPIFDPYPTQNFSESTGFLNTETHFAGGPAAAHHLQFHHPQTQSAEAHITNFYDTRVYGGLSSSYQAVPPAPILSLDPFGQTGFVVVPKTEPVGGLEYNPDFNVSASRIGLNLGGRTYFASSEDNFVNRLYRRSRILEPGSANSPRCQAEGCHADLSHAKHYHRRHKVCEFHSKAATVVAGGLTQRFCQQCSRFHLLSEFDNGKRSCRKRLADHNRRRRKSQQTNQETSSANKSQLESSGPNSSSENAAARSPPDSEPHSSSVTVAISPTRISLDCFGHQYYKSGATGTASSSTASTSSLYFSNGS